jgi:hypothetical protein
MNSAETRNGRSEMTLETINFSSPNADISTVQQLLSNWYFQFNSSAIHSSESSVFPGQNKSDKLLQLKHYISQIPPKLMVEFLEGGRINDKEQYIRLLQATIINLSDALCESVLDTDGICQLLEETLDFIQAFFYQHYDFDYRSTKYLFKTFYNGISLKLDYWLVKSNHSSLIADMKNWLCEANSFSASQLTYRKVFYLKSLLSKFEQATSIISEDYIRHTFVRYNFNAEYVIEYEKDLITQQISNTGNHTDLIAFLLEEKNRVNKICIYSKVRFDNYALSVKEQILLFIDEQIKEAKIRFNRTKDNDILLDPDSKIQTTLSVAKLAVLVRLLVADKIIINKTIAPMLRTITKLFSTLQKDEISFGSFETKYHAPDKNTINMMKEMLQKWVLLIGKLQ